MADNDHVEEVLTSGAEKHGLPQDYLYYVALCGLFPPSRNICKNWSKNEDLFLNLVKNEGKIGKDHFMQSIVLFFVRKYKDELGKYAATFMKKLVDEDVMNEKFLI